jgi:phospholipase/carboxylesterase
MMHRAVVVTATGLICCLLVTLVLASTPERLERGAIEAMQQDDYKKASRLLTALLEQQPGNPRALYNLACCHSRQGELEQSAERLEQAWQAGLREPELVRSDPDLEALRETRTGSALIERLASAEERMIRLRGKPFYFDARVLGGLRAVAPDPMEKDRDYPLVVILHGHGANPERYGGLFELAGTSLQAVVCAPYGPYPIFYENERGYSWYPAPWFFREVLARGGQADDRARRQEIERHEQEVSNAYVLAAIAEVKARYPIASDQVYLMGHSEGGVLAYGLAIRHPELFRGLIVIGSRLRDEDATPQLLDAAAGRLQALICHSRKDQAIDYEAAKSAHSRLKKAGIQSQLVSYMGGHAITGELVKTIATWISHPDRRKLP